MCSFDRAFEHTLGNEGGYANHAADRGGETYQGIARNFHPDWPGWSILDSYKEKPGFPHNAERDEELKRKVKTFYRTRYWEPLSLDGLNYDYIKYEVFDTAVNMSKSKAAKILQEALNLTNRDEKDFRDIAVDGKIGPVTTRTVNTHPQPEVLYKTLNLLQGEHYIEICRGNPSQEVFYRGWLKRVGFKPAYM